MVSPTSSNHSIVDLLFFASVVSLTLVLTFIVAIFVVRETNVRRTQHWERVQATWRPIFLTMIGIGKRPSSVPPLLDRDVLLFAKLWVEYVNKVEGTARRELVRFANDLKLHNRLRVFLTSSNPGHCVLALCVAGRLRDSSATPHLLKALQQKDPTISFTAAMALIRLTGQDCRGLVLRRACTGDWGATFIAKALRELKLSDTKEEVLRLLETQGPKQGGALLQAWAQVDFTAAVQYAREILSRPDSEGWLICGALKILRSPSDVSFVRPCLTHPLWSVRVQAVNAIARIGLRGDIENLAPMMADDNWWLQERVLEAVNGHPQITTQDARVISQKMRAYAKADGITNHALTI